MSRVIALGHELTDARGLAHLTGPKQYLNEGRRALQTPQKRLYEGALESGRGG